MMENESKKQYDHQCIISYELTRSLVFQNDLAIPKNSLPQAELFDRAYFYSITVGIGLPKRDYKLLLDTGSSDIWITNDTTISNAPYDYHGDLTRKLTGETGLLRYMMGLVNFAYATNFFEFAGKTLRDVPYGIAFKTKDMAPLQGDTSGYLGLGYSSSNRKNLPQYLKDEGYIKRNSYSISFVFSKETKSDGGIIFGGIDHSKYTGELYKFPRLNIATLKKKKSLAIKLSEIYMDGKTFKINKPAAFDTGATMSYFPRKAYLAVCEYFGVDYKDTRASGYPLIDIEKTGDKIIKLDFAGAIIAVQGKDFALDYFPEASSNLKVFGIANSDNSFNVPIIGANILKSMYVVYDLDGEEIAIAQANVLPGPSKIEPIVDSIPQAKYAPHIYK
ncbi:uncharacterized protein SAPINGB_P004845 [Magnusiomyces paraingens]|uniref:Peptidase A1 domain-containing protein n=1 Tax=Magnusiomyces paraingens TaxID=2606893 RepID=A0A5E8BXF5_9ASCO|nr:uncharacterized protein SAPINGB_P004845 [Saprochaete ingens]VVT56134.1 unnamed protein product [Saprochaete ingens]